MLHNVIPLLSSVYPVIRTRKSTFLKAYHNIVDFGAFSAKCCKCASVRFAMSFCLSVCPHVITRESLIGFSWNFIPEFSLKFETRNQWYILAPCFSLDLFFDPVDGGGTFLRNVCELPNYKALQLIRSYSSNDNSLALCPFLSYLHISRIWARGSSE
jgi:hypothetical protein